MTDDRCIKFTAKIPLEFFDRYGAATITITPNRLEPEPEQLPPNSPPAEGDAA